MKILYAGSPDAACTTLKILYENQKKYDFEIAGVLSNPPSAKGRHHDLTPTPVAAFALEKGLPLFTPEHLDSAAREEISPLAADLLVCFAYGHIFGPKFLGLFPMGGINLHPSLLPKYRGCTPVPAAILNRDKETAVTIQTLGLKMDEGDILAQKIVELNGSETGESLLNYSATCGAELISELLLETAKNERLPQGRPQTGQASYTSIITKEDGRIDWNLSAVEIEAKIRAYFPEPGCWCLEKGQSLRILQGKVLADKASGAENSLLMTEKSSGAGENPGTGKIQPGQVISFVKSEGIYIKTGNGVLVVTLLQRQGKKVMTYKDFMNGARDFVGTVLE